jgi:hypothetical protein
VSAAVSTTAMASVIVGTPALPPKTTKQSPIATAEWQRRVRRRRLPGGTGAARSGDASGADRRASRLLSRSLRDAARHVSSRSL